MDLVYLASRVRFWRKKRALSQERLSEMIEVSPIYISHIETKRSIPSLETIMKICDALDVTPNDLLLGSSIFSPIYLFPSIQRLLLDCTPSQRRMVEKFIALLVAENEL